MITFLPPQSQIYAFPNALLRSITIGVLLYSQNVLANELFPRCSSKFDSSGSERLIAHLSNSNIVANYCQRLNRHEFLYATETNFHYCNFRNKTSICVENQPHSWYPNLEIASKFSSSNGNSFVLFRSAQLSQGRYGAGFHIFYITAKSRNKRGYAIQSLAGVGAHNGLFSEGGELCSNLNEDEEASEPMFKDKEFEVISEKKGIVGLRFVEKITSCKDLKESILTSKFTWSGNKFVLLRTLVARP